MKKFWKYFLITLLLLIGLACICFLYLFFVPGASLFNITYISLNEEYTSSFYETFVNEVQVYDTVDLTSLNYDVELTTLSNSKGVSLEVKANTFGFTLTKNKDVKIDSKIEGGVLKFTVTEPHGFATKNKSKITLNLPADYALNVTLNNTNALTTISAANINNFSYNTTGGDLNVNAGSISGKINLTLNRAVATLEDKVELKNSDVNLKLTSGKFNCEKLEFSSINILANNTGSVVAKGCNTLKSDLKTSGGRIIINKVETASFFGGDTDINIDELGSGTIKLERAGDVNIKHTTDIVEISSVSGKINIDKADNHAYLYTENTGDISVKDAYVYINAVSEYGNIDVTFNEEAEHFNGYAGMPGGEPRRFDGKTANGKITVKNVENVQIEITNRGRANVYMENVYGTNTIKGNSGDVYVEIKEFDKETAPDGHAHYRLTASGTVNLNLQSSTLGGYNGVLENPIYVNCDASSFDAEEGSMDGPTYKNTLNVSTSSGGLKIRDSRTKNL